MRQRVDPDTVPDEFAEGHWTCPYCGAHFDPPERVPSSPAARERRVLFWHRCPCMRGGRVLVELLPAEPPTGVY